MLKLFVIFNFIAYAFADTLQNCSISISKADQCARKLYHTRDRDQIHLNNLEDMTKYCREMTVNIECIKAHAKCYNPFPRQIMQSVMHNFKKTIKTICSNDKNKQEFIDNLSCIKSRKQSEPIHGCHDKYIMMIKTIEKNFTFERHIPCFCCAYSIYLECIDVSLTSACPDANLTKRKNYLKKNMASVVGDLMEITCSKYKTIEQCKTQLPEFQQLLNIQKQKAEPQKNSAFFHLVKMAIRFDYKK